MISFLTKILKLDFKSSISIITQLEIFDLLINLTNPLVFPLQTLIDNSLLIANIADFFIYIFIRDHQLLTYVLNSSDLLNNMLNYLRIILDKYRESRVLAFVIKKLCNFINVCLILNDDLVVLTLNNLNKNSLNPLNTINIFLCFAEVLFKSQEQELSSIILNTIMLLAPKWQKTTVFLDSPSQNIEKTGEKLLLECFRLFKCSKIDKIEDIRIDKTLIGGLGALLYKGNTCKSSFVASGFFNEVLKEFNSAIDSVLLEESNNSLF